MSERTTVVIQRLIERLHNGDKASREELIAAAQRRLELLTRKMFKGFSRVHRWEDSSDVRQNAAIRLWRALEDVTPATASEFFRLAATQIRRELIDMARHYFGAEGAGANHQSWPSRKSADKKPKSIEAPPQEDDVRLLAEWTEFHERVERLPDEERAAYDLLWYQELTQEEAAQALGISVWTLRRHYRNAKLRLHEWLSENASFSEYPK